MRITEVRIRLVADDSGAGLPLRASCNITLDGCFAVDGLKVIEHDGGLFVAMPSRKLADRCGECGEKNHLLAGHCNRCGGRLDEGRAAGCGRAHLHEDVAHPVDAGCRAMVEAAVLEAYAAEVERVRLRDEWDRAVAAGRDRGRRALAS